jgi:hypothetical protein
MAREPVASEDEFDQYIEERGEPVRGSQRLLIIILSVGCLALAVSNVVLAMRVTQLRRALVAERPAPSAPAASVTPAAPDEAPSVAAAVGTEPRATATERPTQPSAAAADGTATSVPNDRRTTTPPNRTAARSEPSERPAAPEPPTAAASVAAPGPPTVVSEPAPPAPKPKADVLATAPEPPNVDLPPRARQREQARVAAVTRATDRSAAVPSSSSRERATADWMVQEYGRAAAESRARSVAEFYGAHSPDGAYWRRVLAEIVAARR